MKKRNNKHKTHKSFSDGPCGTVVPGMNTTPSQGQTGQNGDFTVELNRKRPVCPRDGSRFVPRTDPGCPWAGSCCPEHNPALNVYKEGKGAIIKINEANFADQTPGHLFMLGQDFHFLLQNPRTPEGFQKGSLKGFLKESLKGFRRVFKGFQKGFRRVSEGSSAKTHLRPFENPSEIPSETPSETPS